MTRVVRLAEGVLCGVLSLGALCLAGESSPTTHGPVVQNVEAVIETARDTYKTNQEIVARVLVTNVGPHKLYLLKEKRAGNVWIDKARNRIVLAHYAFTLERE